MSAEKGASCILDEVNRVFRHRIMFENRISGSHCFPSPITNPQTAFSSDFRYPWAVQACQVCTHPDQIVRCR